MTTTTTTGRRRAVALAVLAGLGISLLGAPVDAQDPAPDTTTSTTAPITGTSAELKEEYDEILGREADLLVELIDAQTKRRDAADELSQLEAQTRATQLELISSTQALADAEDQVVEQISAREEASAAVDDARDRLRRQIVASYVTGGDQGGLLEAVLQSQTGEQAGQALAYGRAISDSTDALVGDLEVALDAQRAAAEAAREARLAAEAQRDAIAAAAELLILAQAQQTTLLEDLNAQVLIEADALAQIQGRKALVEGRINAMARTSDSMALTLAALQADQPDWVPGAVDAVNPIAGLQPGSAYGMRLHPILGISRLHAGVDMGAPSGTEIHAAADGTVVVAEVRGGYGNAVAIDHGSSLATFYAHTTVMFVEPGQEVQRGEVIALVGSTGLSTGPHLHFETRLRGVPVDPESVVDFTRPTNARGYEDLVDLELFGN